jgi:hypothetical protein
MKIGIFEGRLKASKRPVTKADPSVIETGFLSMNRCIRYSNSIQDKTAVTATIAAPLPK